MRGWMKNRHYGLNEKKSRGGSSRKNTQSHMRNMAKSERVVRKSNRRKIVQSEMKFQKNGGKIPTYPVRQWSVCYCWECTGWPVNRS